MEASLLTNSSSESARIKAGRFINIYLEARENNKSNSESLMEALKACSSYAFSVDA
jgi:hypothetical protein